jgi:hypothetical protein
MNWSDAGIVQVACILSSIKKYCVHIDLQSSAKTSPPSYIRSTHLALWASELSSTEGGRFMKSLQYQVLPRAYAAPDIMQLHLGVLIFSNASNADALDKRDLRTKAGLWDSIRSGWASSHSPNYFYILCRSCFSVLPSLSPLHPCS